MKTKSDPNKWAMRGGLLLAVTVLASATSTRGDEATCLTLKPYPMKTCVVDGKKLKKSDSPYGVSWQGKEVKLCSDKCMPEFQKHSAKYLRKISRAEKKADRLDAATSVIPAMDDRPGGLAWSGW